MSPYWDYKCPECELVLEAASKTRLCPFCQKDMTRLPSAPAFILKGAGFHQNDYKKKDT